MLWAVPASSPRTNVAFSASDRQFRLTFWLLAFGSLSSGVLVLGRLTEAVGARLFSTYGEVHFSREVEHLSWDALSLTLAHLTIATLALLGIIWFVATERARLRRLRHHQKECRRLETIQSVTPLGTRERVELFVRRTTAFSTLLMAYWLFEAAFGRYLAGEGFSLGYVEWTQVLPLVSIFGLCVVVGMLVAGISMYGMRLLLSLERLVALHTRRPILAFRLWSRRRSQGTRTLRERFGNDMLSRPPPLGAGA